MIWLALSAYVIGMALLVLSAHNRARADVCLLWLGVSFLSCCGLVLAWWYFS